MPSCAIATCKNTGRTKEPGISFSFHHFPKDLVISQAWLQRCKWKDPASTKNALICSDHFDAEDFVEDKMNKLLNLKQRSVLQPEAIPTKKLPLQTEISSRKTRMLQREWKKVKQSLIGTWKMMQIFIYAHFSLCQFVLNRSC